MIILEIENRYSYISIVSPRLINNIQKEKRTSLMNFEDLFISYLQSTTRINAKLEILAAKLAFLHHPQKIFEKILATPCRPFHLFKILMLLHHSYISNSLNQQLINQIIHQMKVKPVTDIFEMMVDEKVNNPYKLFLQKRIQDEEHLDLSKQELLFRQMNLLSRGSSFGEFLYTFGRYYQNKCEFAIDFNILMGRDLQKIYMGMARRAKKLKIEESYFMELEKIHEKLYVIYYNCYYYRYLKNYVPKWIKTDFGPKKTPIRSKLSSNKSIASISTNNNSPCSDFYIDDEECPKKMTQSALIQSSFNGREMNEFEISQIGLLKSMERVIEEMTQ